MERITIKTVSSKQDWKAFYAVQAIVNAQNPNWIGPLLVSVKDVFNFEKNPFWQSSAHQLFIATDENDKPVGRIAAFYNHIHNKMYHDDCGYFGFLEFTTPSVCSALMAAAEVFLKENYGVKKIVGPLNPSLNYELGVLVEGFDSKPYFMMPYNPEFYDSSLQKAEYQPEMDFFAYHLSTQEVVENTKINRLSDVLMKRYKVSCRTINLKNFEQEAEIIRQIYNDAFSEHWGFIPFEEAEFRYMAKDMTQVMDPQLLFVVEVDSEAAGFILALPNMNEVLTHIPNGRLFPLGWLKFLWYKKRIKTVRVINVAIRKRYMNMGLGAILYAEIGKRLQNGGYIGGEMGWVAANNVSMNSIAEDLGGRQTQKYRVYQKLLI